MRVKVMRWCLRVKLAQNWSAFSRLLLATGDRPIVEESRRDEFWGAKPVNADTLVGVNALGRLLMELREEIKQSNGERLRRVEPLPLEDFMIFGTPIAPIGTRAASDSETTGEFEDVRVSGQPQLELTEPSLMNPSLFDGTVPSSPRRTRVKALIETFNPYPEYKDSGSPWLGSVPKSWQVHSLRTLIKARNERSQSELPLLSVARERGVFVRSLTGEDDNHNVIPEDLSNYKVARAGNLVINKMKAWQGSMGIAPCDGVVSPAYFVFDFCIANRSFGQTLLRSRPYIAHFCQVSDGVRIGQWDLSIHGMRQIPVLIPQPEEQAAIVRFLEHANRHIDRFIQAKKKVIALLTEQKQAIIERAVTRGLDPHVSTKPSGIPWLPDIPKHWDTPLFGRLLSRVEQGWSPVAAEGELASDQWAVLTLSAVRRGVFNPFAIKPVSITANIPTGIEVSDGDVLLTRSNTRDRVGDVCIVRTPRARTILCDLIYRLRLRAVAILPEFLVYQLLSRVGRGQIERDARGSSGTMPKISQGHIKSWRILLPPIDEQRSIIESIDDDSAPVSAAISRLEREIVLLREYRIRLVADVVTGKLDVREAAAQLPSKAETAEMPSDTPTGDEEELEEALNAES